MKHAVDEAIEQIKREFSEDLAEQLGVQKRKFSKELKQRVISESKSRNISVSGLSIYRTLIK